MSGFWAAMQANDWERAARHLAPKCVIDWPCSGERIVGRDTFVAVQARYPTNTGRWKFDVHRLVADGDVVVSEVTVTDGEQSARVVAFSRARGGTDPPTGRVLAHRLRADARSRGPHGDDRTTPLTPWRSRSATACP